MSDEQARKRPSQRWYWRIEHIFAIAAAIVVGIIIFEFTGESELFLAIGSGMGIGMIAWITSYLHLRRRQS